MPVRLGLFVIAALVYVSGATRAVAKNSSSIAPKISSVIYQDATSLVGKDNIEAQETHATASKYSFDPSQRQKRQSYSYGGTQRPVSYNEEYNSPPYYYESNNPPQSYHREYHSPPQSYNHHHSYRSPPQHHDSSYNHHGSNEHNDDYGDNDNDGGYGPGYEENDGYENSPSNRYEREVRGRPRPRTAQEDYTGRFNLDY